MCVWEGSSDWYRDATHHGGILSTFWANWYDIQVKSVQYGLGLRGPRSQVTGDLVCGSETMSDAELQKNRSGFGDEILAHAVLDQWHRDRTPEWERIEVPLLSAANWGGQGLHLRGNVEGYLKAGSRQKWLEVHGGDHWSLFYTDYGIALQKQFFGHFLKGEKNGWAERPPVQLQVRGVDGFTQRQEQQWPIERTEWTRFYLHPFDCSLRTEPPKEPGTITYGPSEEGVTFMSSPLARDTEITGPSSCGLRVSSGSSDADLFLVVRVYTPDLREVTFQGAIDPHTPVGQGWLRASHRKTDAEKSRPWRPVHTHDEKQPLVAGQSVDVQVEILPTSIVVPAGYRIALTVRGRDYEFAKKTGERLGHFKNELRGCGPFLHDDPRDRPPEVFNAPVTLHLGADTGHLLLPIIPE